MSSTKFVHLHVHTEYSLLDGLSNIKKLFSHVKENDMDAIAITDHGTMYGAVEFFKEGKKQEVKPIIGLEAYTTASMEDKKKDNYHLTLLAKDYEGYINLMRLTSIANIDGYYYRPRFTREILKKHSKGLIAFSGCPAAEIPQAIINDETKKAKEITEWFLDVFKDDFYMEIQRHDYSKIISTIQNNELKNDLIRVEENGKLVEEGAVKLSREYGIPLVATNDAHYIKAGDAMAQDALVCIATGKNVSDIKRLRYIDNPDFYIKTPDEMANIFADFPDAIENSVKIAEKCNVEIPLGKWYFPHFEIPKGKDDKQYLEELVMDRLPLKVEKVSKEVLERVKYELDIINTKGYAPYFLIVMDIVNWAADNGIVTNTRGSAAGSLVSYVLGITTVNPLTYYLPFERFLNPYRPSPPDIDFDISDNRREDVIAYMAHKYGEEKTAQICTFGRMLARGSVRDVARVLGYPYAVGDKISKLIPLGSQGFPMTISRALEETAELKQLYDNDPDTKKIIDLSREVEGSARHISVHAAGVVISPDEITKFTPIQKEPKGAKTITQYEMHACEDVGLIKFDILGIRNLSILGSAIQIVSDRRGKKIDLHQIPLDGEKYESAKKTYEMLSRGETMGTFQLSGSGMTKFLKELKPERVEDIMAMVALYRPGPIAVIPEYIERKNNPKKVKFLDPRMEKFLGGSYGLIVYQDDLLFCALDLAGYTWEEADKFRKAVGKKIPEEMAAQKEKFVSGIIANGQTADFAEKLWKLFEPFQAYGFNKAHAASYGMVAYYTSFMKANYPVEYMTALLTAESGDTEKISAAINECRRMGIKVLPPDINESETEFTIVNDKESLEGMAIRFGLSAIKHVGVAAIEAILEARESGIFNSFLDLLTRADGRRVNKKVLESLIKVGALSSFGKRSQLLASLDTARAKIVKPLINNGQEGLFSVEETNKTSAFVSDVTLLDTGLVEFGDEELENLERELLGLSLSARPISELLGELEMLATHKTDELDPQTIVGKMVKIAGVVREVRVITTKKSNAEMAFVKVEDVNGMCDLVVFPKVFTDTRDFWTEGRAMLVHGKVDSRDEQANILVESIQTMESLDKSVSKEAFIKIPSETSTDQLKMLKQIFLENPGDAEVVLYFEKNKKKVMPKMKIAWNHKLAVQIQDILSGTSLS